MSHASKAVTCPLLLTSAATSTDVIGGSITGIATISSIIANTSIVVSATSTLAVGTVLKAYVANPTFTGTITGAVSNTNTTSGGFTTTTGVLYPGMYITGTGVPANTYITSVSGSTITFNQNINTSALVSITGTINIYLTEYAALETNGTVITYSAGINAVSPYNIQLLGTAGTTTAIASLSLGTLQKTIVKMQKEMIEYV